MIHLVALSLYFDMCDSSIFITRQYSPDNKKTNKEIKLNQTKTKPKQTNKPHT